MKMMFDLNFIIPLLCCCWTRTRSSRSGSGAWTTLSRREFLLSVCAACHQLCVSVCGLGCSVSVERRSLSSNSIRAGRCFDERRCRGLNADLSVLRFDCVYFFVRRNLSPSPFLTPLRSATVFSEKNCALRFNESVIRFMYAAII